MLRAALQEGAKRRPVDRQRFAGENA